MLISVINPTGGCSGKCSSLKEYSNVIKNLKRWCRQSLDEKPQWQWLCQFNPQYKMDLIYILCPSPQDSHPHVSLQKKLQGYQLYNAC